MKAPIRISSGRYVDLADFKPEDVKISDINTSLNNTVRFIGHGDHIPLSVAMHSALCLDILPVIYGSVGPTERLAVLMHDFPEAYYNDISTGFKKLLGDAYKKATAPIDAAVYEALWPTQWDTKPEEYEDVVKTVDITALLLEKEHLWKDRTGDEYWPDWPIDPLTRDQLQDAINQGKFMRYFGPMALQMPMIDLSDLYYEIVGQYTGKLNLKGINNVGQGSQQHSFFALAG